MNQLIKLYETINQISMFGLLRICCFQHQCAVFRYQLTGLIFSTLSSIRGRPDLGSQRVGGSVIVENIESRRLHLTTLINCR
jgi:hypothetical protein